MSAVAIDPVGPLDPAGALAWEAKNKIWAGVITLVAGVLTLAGSLLTAAALRDKPSITVFDALRDAGSLPSKSGGLKTDTALYLHTHAGTLTAGQVFTSISGLLAAIGLVYLFKAARARREEMAQWGLIALAVGGVTFFVGSLVPQLAVDHTIANFVTSADHSTQAAHDALSPSAALWGALIGWVGTLGLAVGFLVVAVNAMRVGLLTRFMGFLGIIAGVLFILPILALPIVQAFWLMGLGVLFLRFWPNGMPPAWVSGEAEPWPTRQEQMEARAAAAKAKKGGEPDDPSGDGPATQRAKKKRRRR